MHWVKIRSWHAVTFDSRGGLHHTRCGLWAKIEAPQADDLPVNEKSCESCLRLIQRDEDAG